MTYNSKEYSKIFKYLENFGTANNVSKAKIVAVTKSYSVEDIKEALKKGVRNFGENRVKEAFVKYKILKTDYTDIKLHMIGALQTNKVKMALTLFDYFHSLDRDSLAKEFSKYSSIISSKVFFVQVNTGQEQQKSGIQPNLTSDFVDYCLNDLKLNIVGLMCLPPIGEDPEEHFILLNQLALKNNLKHLSMGMSSDYKIAIRRGATFIRIGSSLFGDRK